MMTNLRFRYRTYEFDNVDIHVRTLRNKQEFEDDDGIAEDLGISSAAWPMFGVVWPSSVVLAHHLFHFDFQGKRILEVGCGIGLTSLLLNHLEADITATDHHPEAAEFLNENTRLNHDPPIPFVRTGWADPKMSVGRFDLIIGSDLLYEDEHVDLLAPFIEQHSRAEVEVILVDPGRGRQSRFGRSMSALGFSYRIDPHRHVDDLEQPFDGAILRFTK